MTREVWITGIGLTSSLGEGLDAHWQAMAAAEHPQPVLDIDELRALPGPSDGAARPRQADPEARRPAPDGGLAAPRHLRRRPRPRRRRHRRQCRYPGAHPHGDRRRAAASATSPVDAAILEGFGGAPTPDEFLNERLSNDLRPTLFLAQLPNLARRQHLDRPQGHRLLAHLHGRGDRRRQRRRDRLAAHRRRPGRHLPRRRRRDRRAQGRAPHPARRRLGLEGTSRARSGRGPKRAAARSSARSAPSSCWRRASTPRRAARKPYARLGPVSPTAARARPGEAAANAKRQFQAITADVRASPGRRALAAPPASPDRPARSASSSPD